MGGEEANQGKKAAVEELLKRLEEGRVSDEELRRLIRIQLERRLKWGYKPTYEQQLAQVLDLAKSLRHMNIGTETDTLDSQMYEVPISFLKLMFGKTVKGSCCYFMDESTTLDEAEIAMLDLYCERAQIEDGQSVLDLGCGQGAVTLHVAQKYKNCHVTGITYSVSQKHFIEEQCKNLQLSNVEIILADITVLEMESTFDRILVIGLFEHMKNYELLLRKISRWMIPDGLLFLEHACHKMFAYQYEDDVSVVNHWILNGKHFARTMEEWLKGLDDNMDTAKEIMKSFSGSKENVVKLINYWRGFCMAGSELCAYNGGEEWMVSHVLFKKR
ncbi:(S)-coclaurine N-methyltransferase-like isoform X2 [Magnolia sinica]|uniref:(S)-coclaurine N-methyltransferase-like isoform X2 n=1 Tax=Magnolia sinica TaxID=86752 RepID=UPI00265B4874|nr:(S)-coclaurine N-methyltransferase-like isoform X2 [Magnolia sinica]